MKLLQTTNGLAKKISAFSLVAALVFNPLAAVTQAANEISRLVPFQGRLHGTDNKAVADGVYDITFNVYDTPTGGTPSWTESHAQVSVIHGYVNVLLGAITPMHDVNYPNVTATPAYDPSKNHVDFTKKKYLGISINGGVEMFPRSQLVPSFHAYTANHADHATQADNALNAEKLGGLTPSEYVTEVELNGSGLSKNSDNLSQLTSASTARTNIDVYSKSEASSLYLNESSNLSDLTNAATARSNLGVYSTTQSNDYYLNESSNLLDLPNKSTARTNLDVYSKAESSAVLLDESSNLSDLHDFASARSNLDVYSYSESDARYALKNNNLSGLTDKSAARDNLGLDQNLTTNVNNSKGSADIGGLRIYYGSEQVAGRNQKTISLNPCFSDTNSYTVVVTNNYAGVVNQYGQSVSRNDSCRFTIYNNNSSTSFINWIAIGHAN